MARVLYTLVVMLSGGLALVMSKQETDGECSWLHPTELRSCLGPQIIFRFSFTCALFFSIMLLGAASKTFHHGYWGLKFVLYVVLFVVSFFIDNDFYKGYGELARVVSCLFLLATVIILIDFAYGMQERWVEKMDTLDAEYEEEYDDVGLCQNKWRLLYLVAVVILFIVSLTIISVLYKFSSDASQYCGTNFGYLSFTLITGIILMIVSPMKSITGGRGLLAPSLVFLYIAWLCWSAITSNPNQACNPVDIGDNDTVATIIAMTVAALALGYTCWSASASMPTLFSVADRDGETEGDEMTRPLKGDIETGSSGASKDKDAEIRREDAIAAGERPPDEDGATSTSLAIKSRFLFHGVMLVASVYMCMVLTNWRVNPEDASTSYSKGTMWVKIITQWVTVVLFAWTLVAPKVCEGRDFS